MDPGFGSTGRQEYLSVACHHSPLWWSVIGFAANSKRQRELHSSSQPVSGYSCPLDELCNGSAMFAFRTAKYLYFAAWIYADLALARPSSSPPPRRFLIRLRPLFSAQASSPSVILHSRAILTSKTLICFLEKHTIPQTSPTACVEPLVRRKHFHQFSSPGRARGHRKNCIGHGADCGASAQLDCGNRGLSQKAEPLIPHHFFFSFK